MDIQRIYIYTKWICVMVKSGLLKANMTSCHTWESLDHGYTCDPMTQMTPI